MEPDKKIKIYEEVSRIKQHFQKEILEEVAYKIKNLIQFDSEDSEQAKESTIYISGEKKGFADCKIWVEELVGKK